MFVAHATSQQPVSLAKPTSRIYSPPYSYYNRGEARAQPPLVFVCRRPQMSIGKKKSEILRLIKRLESDGPIAPILGSPERAPIPGTRTSPTERRRTRPGRSPESHQEKPVMRRRREHLESQEQKLDDLKRRREQLSASLSSRAVEDELQQLQQRVDVIESILRQTNSGLLPPVSPLQSVPLQAPAPQAPAPPPIPAAPAAPHVIGGMLKDGFMSDLLQLISSNEWNGTLVVGEPSDEIRLDFCEGEIWNASSPGATGEGAVFALMTRYDGPYYFTETSAAPEERTIEGNTQFLILEGLRRIDEGGADTQES